MKRLCFTSFLVESSSPTVLKYLGDAGLLSDVSALVARARAQDEANMRKLQNQAKGDCSLKIFGAKEI